MTLYFAEWPDVESALIDADCDASAENIATQIDEMKRPPRRLRRLPPNVIAFSVRVVEFERAAFTVDAGEVVDVLPLPHAGEFIAHLIDTEEDA